MQNIDPKPSRMSTYVIIRLKIPLESALAEKQARVPRWHSHSWLCSEAANLVLAPAAKDAFVAVIYWSTNFSPEV